VRGSELEKKTTQASAPNDPTPEVIEKKETGIEEGAVETDAPLEIKDEHSEQPMTLWHPELGLAHTHKHTKKHVEGVSSLTLGLGLATPLFARICRCVLHFTPSGYISPFGYGSVMLANDLQKREKRQRGGHKRGHSNHFSLTAYIHLAATGFT